MKSARDEELSVTGKPCTDELAALLTVLTRRTMPESGYARWRRTRRGALRRTEQSAWIGR